MSDSTFWQKVWAWLKATVRWVWLPVVLILIVAAAIILVAIGVKDIQIGGLLSKILGKEGKDSGKKAVDVANTVPEDRVDKNGNLIPPGTPDSQGVTQAKVVPIEPTGLFDDPTKVKIIPPGATEPVVVTLPDGVKAKDVDKVIIVTPEVYAVTVKDSSKVTASDVTDLLKKYGG